MFREAGAWKELKEFSIRAISYIFFTTTGLVGGFIAVCLMAIIAFAVIGSNWGFGGVEFQLAIISILGMTFYLGHEIGQEFTQQFITRFNEDGNVIESFEAIEPEEGEDEDRDKSAPLDILAPFFWIGGVVLFSVYAGLWILETPWADWTVPAVLLYGVIELLLAEREVPGPLLLAAVLPFIVGYSLTGFTSTLKDMLPQRILVRHFPNINGSGLRRI